MGGKVDVLFYYDKTRRVTCYVPTLQSLGFVIFFKEVSFRNVTELRGD